MQKTTTGIDQLLELWEPELRNKTWGIVSNDASKTKSGITSRSAIQKAGFQIKCLFSPEHGLSATGADGASQPNIKDPLTGLPVYSLYGQGFKPLKEVLNEIEGIIFDLQDVGVRFYTYIWTMSHLLEACQDSGKTLVVLDRPNPLSGQLGMAEGPMLDEEKLGSFIGRWSIPVRHSLTIGELARFWKNERKLMDLDLRVIPCKGWNRKNYFIDTDLPFFPPSPAINTQETLLTYPALCFLEGTNLSEGRGTRFPFQQFGAPWMDSHRLVHILHEYEIAGVSFSETTFKPKNSRYTDQNCEGIRLNITDRNLFRPINTGIALLAIMQLHFPDNFQWANYPTYANPTGERHIDLLLGNSALKKKIEAYPAELIENIENITDVPDWEGKVTPFLVEDYSVG